MIYTTRFETLGERNKIIRLTVYKMGKRNFKKAVKSLGKKYGQDAVITQQKGDKSATLKRTRKGGLPKKNIKLGRMKPGTTGENDTKIKGKTYTYG